MGADVGVAVFCGLILLPVPIDDQRGEKWPGPLSLIAASLQSSLISSIGCWEAALARVPATVVLHNFNV